MNKTMSDYMIQELNALKKIARNEGMEFTAHFIDSTILTIRDELEHRVRDVNVGPTEARPEFRVIVGGRT